MKIIIGCDHGAYELKDKVKAMLEGMGYEVDDCGTHSADSVDYPDIAKKVCDKVVAGESDRAVLLCGTGIGMSIAANKIDGIRCAHCTDTYSATMAREHNNANVIAIGARITGEELAYCIVKNYLAAEFLGGRHETRVNKFMAFENK